MERLRYPFLLFSLAALLTLSACREDPLSAGITLDADYSGVIAALDEMGTSLSDKLARIETAVNCGLADNLEATKQIQAALASLRGTTETKLAAVEQAVKSQTTSLETKLSLIEAAVKAGFADAQSQQQLLRETVTSMDGTMDEKLAAVETAVKSQATSLETKLGLIEAAVNSGFADQAAAQALMQETLENVGATLEEKLAAIEAAVGNRTTALSARLALIETAVKDGFAADSTQQALIRTALDSLAGNQEEKLAAIEAALKSQTAGLEAKLALVEAAARSFGSVEKLELIRQALASLDGTTEAKLSAIRSAVQSQTTGLGAKIDLISTALEEGFMADTAAIHALQASLDGSVFDLDTSLVNLKDSVVAQLDSLSKELSPDELAKAFTDIVSAIDSQAQSTAALLAAIQNAIAGLIKYELIYEGDPAETINLWRGETFSARLRVKPASVPLVKDSLRLDIVSDKRYFLPELGPGDGADHFFIQSLEAVAGEEGVYVATLKADAPVVLWEESQLSVVMRKAGREFVTDPFPVTIVPRPTEGLAIWHYPRASFKMRELNGIKLSKDSLGVIYAALDSREFVSKDNSSDVRKYTASLVDSVRFVLEAFELHKHLHELVPDDDSLAKVFINFVKGQDYIGLSPDTLESKVWRNFQDSIGHMNLDLKGKLVVTDQWKKKDTIDDFHLGWWNTTRYSDENLKCSINDIDDVQNPGQLKDTIKLESLFDFCGVKNSSLAVVPHYRYSVDRSRFIYPESHKMTGTFVDKNWTTSDQYVNDEWNILLNVPSAQASTTPYSMQGIVTVSLFPSQSQSAFKVQQLFVQYELKLTVSDAH